VGLATVRLPSSRISLSMLIVLLMSLSCGWCSWSGRAGVERGPENEKGRRVDPSGLGEVLDVGV